MECFCRQFGKFPYLTFSGTFYTFSNSSSEPINLANIPFVLISTLFVKAFILALFRMSLFFISVSKEWQCSIFLSFQSAFPYNGRKLHSQQKKIMCINTLYFQLYIFKCVLLISQRTRTSTLKVDQASSKKLYHETAKSQRLKDDLGESQRLHCLGDIS
jgi:hypothetical protein